MRSHLLRFILRHGQSDIRLLTMATLIAGMSMSVVLAVINAAADAVNSGADIEARFFFLYLLATILAIYTRQISLSKATIAVETAIFRLRSHLLNNLAHVDLRWLEQYGQTRIYTQLTRETEVVSQSAFVMIGALQAVVMLTFSLAYIAWLSMVGFFIVFLAVFLGLSVYVMYTPAISEALQSANKTENRFFHHIHQQLNGFKELKLNHAKRMALLKAQAGAAERSYQYKIDASLKFVLEILFSRVFSTLLLGVLVFILPMFEAVESTVIIKIVAASLYVIGPIEMITIAIPLYSKANFAALKIQRLQRRIEQASHTTAHEAETLEQFQAFKTIQLQQLHFSYQDPEKKHYFELEPIDLSLQRGELIFVVGGNGSGKSTLLKLICGLYQAEKGQIVVDDCPIASYNSAAYQHLFAVVFNDFYLFDRLYGLENVSTQAVNDLLRKVGLDKKTQFENGKFSHTDLSTGQRKRLALVCALLEDKPIYILDELAADQDPEFRRYFYQQILPDLRASGKTVLAVTHDDQYFSLADRVIVMDYGHLSDAMTRS